ncbi:MAG: DapH/DapD/GlmU-related protein [Saprospiraceae bacterium]
MLVIDDFIADFSRTFPNLASLAPWEIPQMLPELLIVWMTTLGKDYQIDNGIAIHKTAKIEQGAVLKAPVIIGANCFVGAHVYLRGGVYLAPSVIIGPSCELKTSIVFPQSAVAHFNFIGDSIIGSQVNFEAGALTANHYNERVNKKISVLINGTRMETPIEKFGALVGDGVRVGANAVLSPGTLLKPNTIVKRLELVEQNEV